MLKQIILSAIIILSVTMFQTAFAGVATTPPVKNRVATVQKVKTVATAQLT